jgi:bacteriorhodopsin
MSVEQNKKWFLISFAIFVVSCLVMLFASSIISQSTIVTYIVLALALISLLSWPVFLVNLITEVVRKKSRPPE